MTGLWLAVGAMVAVVLGMMLRPLLAGNADAGPVRAEFDIAVFKDQLAELARDNERGLLGEAEYTAARIEIERRLLTAAGDEETAGDASAHSGGRASAVVIALAVPLAALALYLHLGKPTLPDRPFAQRTDTGGDTVAHVDQVDSAAVAGLSDMVAKLAKRLEKQPDDLDGWVLLARTFVEMKNFAKAAEAYGQAVTLSDRHPVLLADHAEARLMAAGGQFTPAIHADFVAAFEADPALPKPWYYLGLDRAIGRDFRGAVKMWVDLIAISDADAPYLPAVREQIAKAARDGGFDAAAIKPTATATRIVAAKAKAAADRPAGAGAPALSAEQRQAVAGMSDADRQAMIHSMVQRLADRLEENPNDRDGWLRLARAYDVLGEADKAKDARARAKALP